MEKGLAKMCLAWDSFWQAILDRKMSWLFVFYPDDVRPIQVIYASCPLSNNNSGDDSDLIYYPF